MCINKKLITVAFAVLFCPLMAAVSMAQPVIQVDGPFNIQEQGTANEIGFGIGRYVNFGVQSALPVSAEGTAGVATQGSISVPLYWPNSSGYASGQSSNTTLTGPWTLTFTNPCCPDHVVQTPTTFDSPPPFVENFTISGSGTTPTFKWIVPNGYLPDAVAFDIRDRRSVHEPFHYVSLPGNATEYTVPSVLSELGSLDPENTSCYGIMIALLELRDENMPDYPENTLGRSISHLSFCASEEAFPLGGIYIPIITEDGVLTFNMYVSKLVPVVLDPAVATGYEFRTEAGNPNFAYVELPAIGDDKFYVTYESSGTVMETVRTGDTLVFPDEGVSMFSVTGIETAAAISPRNPLAFMATVGFVSDGRFTGSMTPLITDNGPTAAAIDIMPFSTRNRIQTNSHRIIPVALLGSTTLDVTTLTDISAIFGPAAVTDIGVLHWNAKAGRHIRDMNRDGFADLVFLFENRKSGLTADDTAACLLVNTSQGDFGGCDAVEVVNRRDIWFSQSPFSFKNNPD